MEIASKSFNFFKKISARRYRASQIVKRLLKRSRRDGIGSNFAPSDISVRDFARNAKKISLGASRLAETSIFRVEMVEKSPNVTIKHKNLPYIFVVKNLKIAFPPPKIFSQIRYWCFCIAQLLCFDVGFFSGRFCVRVVSCGKLVDVFAMSSARGRDFAAVHDFVEYSGLTL